MRIRILTAGAALAAALIGSSAQAQFVVLGESPAASCYRNAAALRMDHDALAECDMALEQGMTNRRNRAATYVNRGIIRMMRDDLEGALVDFDEGESMRPELAASIAVNRSAAFIRLGRFVDAVSQANYAIANDANDMASAHFNRAIALEELGDLNGAYHAYRDALTVRPGWIRAQRELDRFVVRQSS